MKDLINELYAIALDEKNPFGELNEKEDSEETLRYKKLFASLTDKQQKEFLEYDSIQGVRIAKENRGAYRCGFKTAMRLCFEVFIT
ncbi:MAG: hypothetical protein IJZ32_03680 [Clostridia bacterium]|nr:hypothetical protein [Clostridia bacterium]